MSEYLDKYRKCVTDALDDLETLAEELDGMDADPDPNLVAMDVLAISRKLREAYAALAAQEDP